MRRPPPPPAPAARLAALSVAALLAALAAPAVAQPAGPEPEDSLFFRGAVASAPDPSGRSEVVRFELVREDTTVVLTPLGRVQVGEPLLSRTRALSSVIDSSGTAPAAPIRISASAFERIADQVEGALTDTPPPPLFGFSYEDGRLRLRLDQGISVLSLGLGVFGLVAASAGLTALVLGHRERRRQRDAAAAEAAGRRNRVAATEAERVRLAREIHDGPLQELHALRLRLSALDPTTDPEGLAVEAAAGEAAATARELRAVTEGLRPPALGRFGLGAALRSLGERAGRQHPGVSVRVDVEPGLSPLVEPAAASLFRVAQEALTNALRHSGARQVRIGLGAEPSTAAPVRLRLEIQDDGHGMPPDFDAKAAVARGHFGLTGIRERAELLGGRLSVEVGPGGRGTTVRAVVPWEQVAAAGSAGVWGDHSAVG